MPKKAGKRRWTVGEGEGGRREREKMWRGPPLPTSVMRRRMENYDDGIKSHRYFLSPSLSLTLPKDFDFLLENSWAWMQCCYNEGSAGVFRAAGAWIYTKGARVVVKSADSCGVKNRSGLCCWRYEWRKNSSAFPAEKPIFLHFDWLMLASALVWVENEKLLCVFGGNSALQRFSYENPGDSKGFTLLFPLNDC